MAEEENKLEFPVTLVKELCITCGVRFAVPEYYQTWRKRDHKDFTCPNGHQQHYNGSSDQDTINTLTAQIVEFKRILKCIVDIEVNAVFNKGQLETAIQLAKGGLK